jgi:outer membrane protein TolC
VLHICYVKNKMIIFLLLLAGTNKAQITFTSLDSVLSYTQKKSSSIKITNEQNLLAKWTKIAALGNTINLRSPISFSSTDNTMLPVNFIPADAFGGPPGTFRQITLGQQYVSNFNINPQIDIINPYAWAKVKSASINKEMTEVNSLLIKKNLFESIAAAYYNCVSIQDQINLTQQSLQAADSIVFIVQNKYSLGIVREQDLNNAKVNQLNVTDKLNQLKLMLQQQQNSLKILCDIPASTKLSIVNEDHVSDSKGKAGSSLPYRYTELQAGYARSELRANRLNMFPIISLVGYQGWQQNSNTAFFDNNASWIQSRYIGLRITVPFPPDVTKLSQSYTSKINYHIAQLNNDHTKLQTELSNESLNIDAEKANSSYQTAKQIVDLKKANYEKSINQYKEGILPTDNLLTAFSDLLNSELNFISAYSNLQYNNSKININNTVK